MTEKHWFFSRVLQLEPIDSGPGQEDWLPFTICLNKQIRCWYDHAMDFNYQIFADQPLSSSILYSCADHRRGYTAFMAGLLSDIGVPQQEHPTILDKLFGVVLSAFPKRRICILIADVTVRLLGSFQDLDTIGAVIGNSPSLKFNLQYRINNELYFETYPISSVDYHGTTTPIDRLTLESFEALPRIVRFVPATRSSIESLKKVRLDCLEEATIKRNPSCNICRGDFAQGSADQLIIPLPCTHCYHVDCIISWLEVSHFCPLCRYAMPTVEEGRPSIL